jgi:hypothetical protein
MPCDKDIEELIRSTQKAGIPIAVAIEREREKLKARQKGLPDIGVLSPPDENRPK